jgi:hypothetical protein
VVVSTIIIEFCFKYKAFLKEKIVAELCDEHMAEAPEFHLKRGEGFTYA